MDLPAPPADLQQTGAEFWSATLAAYELDARDLPVLLETSRALDEIDQLKATVVRDGVLSTGSRGQPIEHPALAGLRAHRLTLDRLLNRLALPDEEGTAPMTTTQRAGKTAADARWRNHRQAKAAGG